VNVYVTIAPPSRQPRRRAATFPHTLSVVDDRDQEIQQDIEQRHCGP
jgi:hypothetical protein